MRSYLASTRWSKAREWPWHPPISMTLEMCGFKDGPRLEMAAIGMSLSRGLCERFGDRGMMDIVEEFNKLKQEGTVQEY